MSQLDIGLIAAQLGSAAGAIWATSRLIRQTGEAIAVVLLARQGVSPQGRPASATRPRGRAGNDRKTGNRR
jgi:hypothetical protein